MDIELKLNGDQKTLLKWIMADVSKLSEVKVDKYLAEALLVYYLVVYNTNDIDDKKYIYMQKDFSNDDPIKFTKKYIYVR